MRTAVGLALAVLLTIAAAGGTYALWTAQVNLPGATITAGNASLTIDGPTGLDTEQLYPGETVSGLFTVRNTGTVALALRVDSLTWSSTAASPAQQAFAQALNVHVWPDLGSGCDTAPADPVWSGTFSSLSGQLGVTVDPKAVQPMCLTVALAADAPGAAQGASIDLQLTVGGVQR